MVPQGGHSAIVHDDLPPVAVAHAGKHPALAGFQLAGGRLEVGAHGFAAGGAQHGVGAAAPADDHCDAGGGHQTGGVQFGGHTPPGPGVAMPAGHGRNAVVNEINHRDGGCGRVDFGVGGVQAIHIGQDNQQVSVNEGGDEGGEAVVVAENLADFVGGDHIVFVEDGDDAQVQQG